MTHTAELGSEVLAAFRASEGSFSKHFILSSPHYLYATDEQAALFERATTQNKQYKASLEEPVDQLLRTNIDRLCGTDCRKFDFVDLGPGSSKQSFSLVDGLTSTGNRVRYVPVDISPLFLNRAVELARMRNINIHSIQCKFEDLGERLRTDSEAGDRRIVFIGLTFNNFDLSTILQILQSITRPNDICLVCAQLPDRLSEKKLVEPYRGRDAFEFGFRPLSMIGLRKKDVEYTPAFYRNAINIDFVLRQDVRIGNVVFCAGTVFTTSRSFRHPMETLKCVIEKAFSIRNCFTDSDSGIAVISLGGKQR